MFITTTKFATYPPSRSSAASFSKLGRLLKRISPKSKPRAPLPVPTEHTYLIPAGPSIVTEEQAIADTKVLMEFYLANAERDLARERRRCGVADFSRLH